MCAMHIVNIQFKLSIDGAFYSGIVFMLAAGPV